MSKALQHASNADTPTLRLVKQFERNPQAFNQAQIDAAVKTCPSCLNTGFVHVKVGDRYHIKASGTRNKPGPLALCACEYGDGQRERNARPRASTQKRKSKLEEFEDGISF